MAIIGQIPATKMRGYNYSIHFKNIEKPIELAENETVMKDINIISHPKGDNIYTVQSQINDKAIKDLLTAEYNLEANQVAVTSLQNSGPLGAM